MSKWFGFAHRRPGGQTSNPKLLSPACKVLPFRVCCLFRNSRNILIGLLLFGVFAGVIFLCIWCCLLSVCTLACACLFFVVPCLFVSFFCLHWLCCVVCCCLMLLSSSWLLWCLQEAGEIGPASRCFEV